MSISHSASLFIPGTYFVAVFDWYVLLLILANFKEYRINVTKSRMRLSLILSKLYKTLWIWYYQRKHPAVLLHFKCSKGFRSVAGGAHLCAFWNLPDLLIIGEPSLPSHKHEGWEKITRMLSFIFAAGFASEMQHVWILRYIEPRDAATRDGQGASFTLLSCGGDMQLP